MRLPAIIVACASWLVGTPSRAQTDNDGMPTSKDVVLVGAGDIADCESSGDEQTAVLVERILKRAAPASRAFTAGDNVYPDGSADEFRRCYMPSWGRFLAQTLPVAGNHDWMTEKAAGYFAAFGPRAGSAERPWRSVNMGAWHVVLLDSDCDEVGGCQAGSAQHQWLIADLKASKARCTVAIWHHPLRSSGPHGDDARTADLWRALHDAGADVVLNGHEHLYERFAPADADGNKKDGGMVAFTVGTGGKTAYPFRPFARPDSDVRKSGTPAVLMLTLEPAAYRFAVLGVNGAVLDQGARTCRE